MLRGLQLVLAEWADLEFISGSLWCPDIISHSHSCQILRSNPDKSIRIGVDSSLPPFEATDPYTNDVVGFDIELKSSQSLKRQVSSWSLSIILIVN